MKTLISLDFDFFVREDPMWDWGHNENQPLFLLTLWGVRYTEKNLYEECNPAAHANFMPEDAIIRLIDMGFTFKKKPLLYVAESHKDIYEVMRGLKRSEVYHFDAHHDLYDDGDRDLNCGNWGRKAIEQGLVEKYIWVAPDWGKEFDMMDLEDIGQKEIKGYYYNEFLKERKKSKPIDIDAIFVCRSGAWVPPHLDGDFLKMTKGLSCFSQKTKIIGNIIDRKDYAPTKEKAAKAYRDYQKIVKKLKASWSKTQQIKIPTDEAVKEVA